MSRYRAIERQRKLEKLFIQNFPSIILIISALDYPVHFSGLGLDFEISYNLTYGMFFKIFINK